MEPQLLSCNGELGVSLGDAVENLPLQVVVENSGFLLSCEGKLGFPLELQWELRIHLMSLQGNQALI